MPFLPKASDAPSQWPSAPPMTAMTWQKDMQEAFRSVGSLLKFLELRPSATPSLISLDPAFPILVTKTFAEGMIKGDWYDPLLLQVLPQSLEEVPAEGFRDDAVGDLPSQIIPGLLHKYASRALMMISPQCAIHCRYCFRREFPYGDLPKGKAAWNQAWEYLAASEGIDEIVFSGGDPLFLDNRRLEEIVERALALTNIRTLRFHTRLPVVLPSRMEPRLLEIFRKAAEMKTLVVVIHANHANELGTPCLQALADLKAAGAMLLNQTVLLKGINDDTETLAELSRTLVRNGVLPYYLHQLDRVTGTSHFEVSETRGLELISELRRKLPGYAVPRYVRETAGEAHKTPLI